MKQNAASLFSDDSGNNAVLDPLDDVEFDLGDDDLETLPLGANRGAKGQKDAATADIGGNDVLGATDLVEENDSDDDDDDDNDLRRKVGRSNTHVRG